MDKQPKSKNTGKNPFHWIISNKEWLFSGIGLTVIIAIYSNFPKILDFINNIDLTKKYYFGYLPDSYPVSLNKGNSFSGYCHDLMLHLEKKLDMEFEFEEAIVPYENRFTRSAVKKNQGNQKIRKSQLLIECGPNTINSERRDKLKVHNGEFSDGFYVTGTKLLFKKGNDLKSYLSALEDNEIPLKDMDKKVAIIGTTTSSLIGDIYSQATVEPFPNRGAIVDALASSPEIIAYASDELLLRGFYSLHWDELTKTGDSYFPSLLPKSRLSHEEYGVVVYNVDKAIGANLLNKINDYVVDMPLEKWLEKNPGWDAKWRELEASKQSNN